jgi:cytochrome c-type biogenesis protein
VVDAAREIQSTLVDWVDAIGPVPTLAALTALVAGGVLLARRHRARAG